MHFPLRLSLSCLLFFKYLEKVEGRKKESNCITFLRYAVTALEAFAVSLPPILPLSLSSNKVEQFVSFFLHLDVNTFDT